jgi:hypothetical protein
MKAKNVLAASALLEQGLSDIFSLQTERNKIRSAGLLNQQKLTSEALGTQYKAAQQFYNTLMASDDKSSDEFKVFADRAWSNLKEIENTYNKFHGIANLPQVSAMKIFQHEISLLPEGKTSWNDSLLEAIKRKPSYADVPEDVWQGVEVIWKASQPKAKESDKKAAGDLLQSEDIMPFLPNPEGKTLDELIPSVEDIKKFEEEGTLLERLGEFLVPSAGAADFRTNKEELTKDVGIRNALSNARSNLPINPLAPRAMLETTGDKIMGGLAGLGSVGLGMGIAGGFQNFGEQMFGEASTPTGETSQLIPNSAVQELQSLDQKSIGTGTGGMLSFAEELKLSNKVIKFLKELSMYEAEYGEAQARRYVSKEFAKLSEKEQAEVVEILELQRLDQKSIGTGTGTGGMLSFNREDILGMPETVDQVEQFLRQYQTYLAEFGEDQAEELLEAQFQTLPFLAQEEILKILSPDETPIETPTSQIPARFLRDLSNTFKYIITGNPYEEGMFGSQKRRHYGPKF